MASDVIVTTYRVGYLGSCPAISNASGLAMVQKALRELYLGKSTKIGISREEVQRPRTLEITSFGLAVKHEEMRTKTGNIVEVTEMLSPFTTIMLWAALRFCAKKTKNRKKKLECAFLPLICTDYNLETSMFAPLDSKYSFVTKVKHPALFCCVLRHPETPRAMECHAFVCRNHSEALEIAWNLHEALMQYTKIRRLTRNPMDTYRSSKNSVIPLVNPNGRLQRLEDPITSSLISKKSSYIKSSKKNTVVFADVCAESSGRGSASSRSESSDEYLRSNKYRGCDPIDKSRPSCSYDKVSTDDGVVSSPKTSDISSSPMSSNRTGTSDTNLNWHNRHKVFGGVRVLPPGKPPSRSVPIEDPEVIFGVPDADDSSFSNISSHKYTRKPTSSRFRNFSPSRKSSSMHELYEVDLGQPASTDYELPADNLTKRIFREKKTVEETRTVKKGVKVKETKFPLIKLKMFRQRDSSLERDSDSKDNESPISTGTSGASHQHFSKRNGVYRDGDSWKKYYWKDDKYLDLEKTMCATDWDVRKFSNKSPENSNPHISWSRTNLESSLGYIP